MFFAYFALFAVKKKHAPQRTQRAQSVDYNRIDMKRILLANPVNPVDLVKSRVLTIMDSEKIILARVLKQPHVH
jgi:hypothetical protein